QPAVPAYLAGERLGRVPDLPLPGQEHQDVAGAVFGQLRHRLADRLRLVGLRVRRPVADLHRVGAAGDLDHRRVGEVAGEPVRIDGGRRDDQLQIGAAGEQPGQVPEDEVDVEAAFVRLVHDQRVVPAQLPVGG